MEVPMTLKISETHQHGSLGFGRWNVLRAMGGFEQVHQHFQAGNVSRDRNGSRS
jgi:hypothetical protein